MRCSQTSAGKPPRVRGAIEDTGLNRERARPPATGGLSSQRIALGVEYDGSGFCGWQTQAGVRTVQAALEAAIGRVADEPVRWARPVDPRFHARFSAIARHYRYLIMVRSTRSPLHRDRVVWTHRLLDTERMGKAGQTLVGVHDFSSFRAVACQAKSPIRHVHYLELTDTSGLIELRIGANGFLHHMVRNIVGVLMMIGRGDAPVGWTRDLLSLRDRRLGGVTAPPHGLYFVRADYPAELHLPPVQSARLSGGLTPSHMGNA
jgi:tRNA pseudouridine38-40 synthase